MGKLRAFEYRAFITFSPHDRAWAKWLQSALESYSIASDLVGRPTPAGTVPKTLRPIYLDREAADRGPGEQALAALRASEHLIVVCSPHAAQSRRVNETIRQFTYWGRADRVLPLIVEGEPGHLERECFAPALRFRLPARRLAIDRRGELAATDPRLDRDGRHHALHKLVAALLCLSLSELEQRARALQIRHLRIRSSGIAGALLVMGLGWQPTIDFACKQLARDEARLEQVINRATALAQTLELAAKAGLPSPLLLPPVAATEALIRATAELGGETPRLRLREASGLIDLTRIYAELGGRDVAQARVGEVDRLLQAVPGLSGSNFAWQREVAAAYDRLGETLYAHGRLGEALASYRAASKLTERLASDPANIEEQYALALSYLKLGNVQLDMGTAAQALANYNAGLIVAEVLAAVDPGRPSWQHALATAHQKIGDVLRRRNELDAAFASYRESRAIAERLRAGDPANPEWQRSVSLAYVKLADVIALQGRAADALDIYRTAVAISAEMVHADPGHDEWQKDLGIVRERIGLALEALGDQQAAAAEYGASFAIARRLAADHPGNAGWQRDLAIAHQHLGDLYWARADLAQARDHYRANREIMMRLVADNPDHAGWQYDLGASHARMALLLETVGEFDGALLEYEACLTIGSRFVDPANPKSQRDLAVSYGKLAVVLHHLGRSGQAISALREARRIIAALLESGPEAEHWARDLASFDSRIASLEGRGGLGNGGPLATETMPGNGVTVFSAPSIPRAPGSGVAPKL